MTELIIKKYDGLLKENNIISKDLNIIFNELCKINNIKPQIINDFMNIKSINYTKAYNNIYLHFINTNDTNITNIISIIKYFIKYLDIETIKILINQINNKINKYTDNKQIYSSLKTLCIDCNKCLLKNFNNNDTNKVNVMINLLKNTQNIKRILFYIKKILIEFEKNNDNINYIELINIIYDIINNNKIIFNDDIEYILKLINKCKAKINKRDSELEDILYKTDKNLYEYIYFLKNENNLLDNQEKILTFLEKFNYNKKCFQEIDKLNLKRGFIKGICKNNKNYLLKYQPNKSVMELVLNCYIKLINKNNFLIPKYFFINSDNSYFYIIDKYHSDLYKYFNILNEHNKILTFKQILSICLFIINSIIILHKNNIIHSDLKLENIVLNYDDNKDITELKIIDFDVGLFETVPPSLTIIPNNYQKIFNNKKIRGTRIYMLKDKAMSFNNDIFSLGVISLILLYKNIKILINIKKNCIIDNSQKNKKLIIKYLALYKKFNSMKDNIEDNDVKIKMLELLEDYFKLNKCDTDNFFDNNYDINKFVYFKNFIIDCINAKNNINEIVLKYKILFENLKF